MISSTSRSAFATMIAIVLLGLVTVALVSLVTVSRGDHQRTLAAVEQAQLRQIILAAVIDANEKAMNWGNAPSPRKWTVDLPAASGFAEMKMSASAPDRATVQLAATAGKTRTIQSLKFARIDLRWQLVEVKNNAD